MPTADVNGIKLYYEVHGDGSPLLLIMGMARNHQWFFKQIEPLSRRFRVIAFDNRAAGRSGGFHTRFTIRDMADDTAGLIDHLKIGSAHVFGVSMGGFIAQELALNHPKKVRSLILGCTSCGGTKQIPASSRVVNEYIVVNGMKPEQVLRKNLDKLFSDHFIRESSKQIEEFIGISLKDFRAPLAFIKQSPAVSRHDTTDRLGQIALPTLILSGTDDPLMPPGNSDLLEAFIPGSTKTVFTGARHGFFIEHADAVNETIADFIGNT